MLQAAISIWRNGEPLPVDMAAGLLDLGYDVSALQERYAL